MPAVVCPFCAMRAALPDPWPHPGFTCPHCRASVALATPTEVAPPPDPFAIDDEPARPRRHRRRVEPEGAHPLLIVGGYLCALLSLGFFPPALGLSGAIFGGFCLAKGSTANGMLIVVLSLVCATIGAIWGVEVVFWGRPRFLIDY